MPKPLSSDEILGLLAPKPKKPRRKNYENVNTDSDIRKFNVLTIPQAGEMQPGDKGDIWAQWVKQGRKGAEDLIARWG